MLAVNSNDRNFGSISQERRQIAADRLTMAPIRIGELVRGETRDGHLFTVRATDIVKVSSQVTGVNECLVTIKDGGQLIACGTYEEWEGML